MTSPLIIFGALGLVGAMAASASANEPAQRSIPSSTKTAVAVVREAKAKAKRKKAIIKAIDDGDIEKAKKLARAEKARIAKANKAKAAKAKAAKAKAAKAKASSKKKRKKKTKTMSKSLQTAYAKVLKALTVTEKGKIKGPVSKEAVQAATQLAARIRDAGFPSASKQLRKYAVAAAKKVPSPPRKEHIDLPPTMPQEMKDRLNRMLQSERDPEKLKNLVRALAKLPKSSETSLAIGMLKSLILQIETAAATQEALEKADEVMREPSNTKPTAEVPPARPQLAKTEPVTVPAKAKAKPKPKVKTKAQQTAEAMVSHLRALQSRYGVKGSKGREDREIVKRFQNATGGGADGLAGPGTMSKAAASGQSRLPRVMYWPRSSTRARVQKYRNTLGALATKFEDAGHRDFANELRMSAAMEKGEGGIVGPLLS